MEAIMEAIMDADAHFSSEALGWIIIAANVNLAGWILAGALLHGERRRLRQAHLRIALREARSECAPSSWRP